MFTVKASYTCGDFAQVKHGSQQLKELWLQGVRHSTHVELRLGLLPRLRVVPAPQLQPSTHARVGEVVGRSLLRKTVSSALRFIRARQHLK